MNDGDRKSAAEITAWLVAAIERLTQIPAASVDPEGPLVDYLTDSRDALTLAADLQDWVGFEVSTYLVWDYPTLAALASHLAEGPRAPR